MDIEPKQASSAKMAIGYITLGSLMVVWSLLYWLFMRSPQEGDTVFWIIGAMLSGVVLVVIGLLLGRIGLAARQAEVAPAVVAPPVAAPPVATVAGTAPVAGNAGAAAAPSAPATAGPPQAAPATPQ